MLGANSYDETNAHGKATYGHLVNDHDIAILKMKLNAHGEVTYERPANARREATFAVQLDARGEPNV